MNHRTASKSDPEVKRKQPPGIKNFLNNLPDISLRYMTHDLCGGFALPGEEHQHGDHGARNKVFSNYNATPQSSATTASTEAEKLQERCRTEIRQQKISRVGKLR